MTEFFVYSTLFASAATFLGLGTFYLWGRVKLIGRPITPYYQPAKIQKILGFVLIYPVVWAATLGITYLTENFFPDSLFGKNIDEQITVMRLTVSLLVPFVWGIGIGRKWYNATVYIYNKEIGN